MKRILISTLVFIALSLQAQAQYGQPKYMRAGMSKKKMKECKDEKKHF